MIKVRIWDKQYKRWANPSLFCLDGKGEITWSNALSPTPKSMDEFVIQQFTGLKDKNGKEIFQGDRVKYTYRYHFDVEVENKLVVEFIEGTFTHLPKNDIVDEDDFYSGYVTNYEVVGNICENPKL